MAPDGIVGKTGRAVTAVGTSGRVEIDGRSHEAMTFRRPIDAGQTVEVTGWRADGATGYVLSVRLPGDTGPALSPGATPAEPVPPPTPEERIRELERQIARLTTAQAARPADAGPACYSCSSPATTRCQSCGTLSCATHIASIYVQHGRGGAYELRCDSCYSSAMVWKVVGGVFGVIVVIVMLSMFASRGR